MAFDQKDIANFEYGTPRVGDWIQTHGKVAFHPEDPRVADISIEDIAHALSMQCRFGGHTKAFYSVAEHSVRVAEICPPEHQLWGLLHDASEAYLVDIPRPIKQRPDFWPYRRLEEQVMAAVCERFGLDRTEPPDVKEADEIILATEGRDLMSPYARAWALRCEPLDTTIVPWSPDLAKHRFLEMFDALFFDGASQSELIALSERIKSID